MSFNEIKQHGTADFPFELYKIDHTHPKYEMAMHWHYNAEIIRVLKGKLSVSLNNRKLEVTEGETVFVNSETIHGATPSNCAYECIVFDLAFLKSGNLACDSFLDNLLNHHAYIFDKINSPDTNQIIDKLFTSLDNRADGFQFKVIGAINELIGTLKEKKSFAYQIEGLSEKDERKVLKLKRILTFIRENFDKELTLDDMAVAAELSTKYFCSFFKTTTGKTPIEYLNDYRVERAARKLLGTDMAITQIAYSCGFNDLSYFIKTFKQIKGCTPKNYRKNSID
ncbi:MAG: helix-turn-helix domain-containing protein [Clostridiales bacterium]|nr:helix-turn-helix domain-containing protein [Clostridiales bacterium]